MGAHYTGAPERGKGLDYGNLTGINPLSILGKLRNTRVPTPTRATELPAFDSFTHRSMKLSLLLLSLPALALLACGGPPRQAAEPKNSPHSTVQGPEASVPSPASEDGHHVMLGWFCPEEGAGRPAIRPLFAKDPTWDSELDPLHKAIASRRVKRFTVLAWEGHSAGSMIVMGAAQDALGKMAMGAYVGASVCLPAQTTAVPARSDEDPVCRALSAGCGLALGELEAAGGFHSRPYEEDPERLNLFRGAACEGADILHLDTDGDGKAELFSIADLRRPGAPPAELPLAMEAAESCSPNFAASVPNHPDLVRIAVLDVDGDGRSEVLYRRNSSEFLLYGAPASPARLELLGRQSLSPSPK